MVSKNTFKPQAAECQCIHCSKLWCSMLLSSNTGSSTAAAAAADLFFCMFLCFVLAGCCCQLYTQELMSTLFKEHSYICIFQNHKAFHEGCPAKPCSNLFQGCLLFAGLAGCLAACFAVGLVAKLDQLFGLILCIFDASHNYQQVLFQDLWLSLLSFLKEWLGAFQHLCQLLKHGLLVLQACLAQGLFFTFFKASKLLWVLVGISLAAFSFFKPSSKDKGASPSSSSSSSSSPSPLVKAAKFPFLPSALPLPLPLPFSRPLLCLFQGYTAWGSAGPYPRLSATHPHLLPPLAYSWPRWQDCACLPTCAFTTSEVSIDSQQPQVLGHSLATSRPLSRCMCCSCSVHLASTSFCVSQFSFFFKELSVEAPLVTWQKEAWLFFITKTMLAKPFSFLPIASYSFFKASLPFFFKAFCWL